MMLNDWTGLTEEARRAAWDTLTAMEKSELYERFGGDPVARPATAPCGGHTAGGPGAALGGAILVLPVILVLGLILWWWSGVSQRRLDAENNAPMVRAQQLAAMPGYKEGRDLGYELGLAGAGNPTHDALKHIGRLHAEKHGHKYDDAWVDAFGKGYRDGLIAAYDKKQKDRDRWQ